MVEKVYNINTDYSVFDSTDSIDLDVNMSTRLSIPTILAIYATLSGIRYDDNV